MSMFYCDFHGQMEDSDEVGIHEWCDEIVCDGALEEMGVEEEPMSDAEFFLILRELRQIIRG